MVRNVVLSGTVDMTCGARWSSGLNTWGGGAVIRTCMAVEQCLEHVGGEAVVRIFGARWSSV